MKVVFKATAPINHGSLEAGIGNAVNIRREPIVSLPGMPSVPVISGNSIRGQVRRFIMRELFAKAGLGVGSLPGKQWDMLYGALANGGHLTGKEKSPTPAKVRELREALPPLSVLGSAMYRYMLPGRVQVGFGWPVCQQTVEAGLVVAEGDTLLIDAADLVTETSFARHIERDLQNPEMSGVTPMPVTLEALATGTELHSVVTLSREATEVERACVSHAFKAFDWYLGGKSAAGMGAVSVFCSADDQPYVDWLTSTDVKAALVALAASL